MFKEIGSHIIERSVAVLGLLFYFSSRSQKKARNRVMRRERRRKGGGGGGGMGPKIRRGDVEEPKGVGGLTSGLFLGQGRRSLGKVFLFQKSKRLKTAYRE